MSEPNDFKSLASPIDGSLTFPNAHYQSGRFFIRPFGTKPFQQSSAIRNHRHTARFAILRSRVRIASDDDFAFFKIAISPRHKCGFTFDTQARVGKEFDQIRAGQPRPERNATNLLNKCLKLFLRRKRQIFSIHPHPFQIFSRIAVTDAMLDGDCKDGAQHDQRVVVIRRTGLLCVTGCPLTAIILAQPAHVGVVEFRPTFLHRGKAFFVILFGSRLEVWHSIKSFQILFCQIPKKRRSLDQTFLSFQFGALLLFQISQFEFGYGQYIRLEALTNKLAANSDSSKVFTRWCVSD